MHIGLKSWMSLLKTLLGIFLAIKFLQIIPTYVYNI